MSRNKLSQNLIIYNKLDIKLIDFERISTASPCMDDLTNL